MNESVNESKGTPNTIHPANDAEWLVLRAARKGKWAVLPRTEKNERRIVRATFLRCVLSDMSTSAHAWERSGLRIRGAYIEGVLDLANWSATGGDALPPLLLDRCDIPEMIEISYAHLARLSVTKCRISHIHAEGVRIGGRFDFSGVRPYEAAPGGEEMSVAWIEGRGCRIEGAVAGRGAHLKAPPPRPAAQIILEAKRFALDLGDSYIGGKVILMPNFKAVGGVSFANSEVIGETWLRGAKLSSGESDAFCGQSAKFSSGLMLDEGFLARGPVCVLGAKMAWLYCDNAVFENRTPSGESVALELSGAEIRGFVGLRGRAFRSLGSVNCRNTKIAGSISAEDATFENRAENGSGDALNLSNSEIGGSLWLNGAFHAAGQVSLTNVKVSGDVNCYDANFENSTEDGNGSALTLANAVVGGDLNFSGKGFKGSGQISIQNAKIAGDVWLSHATFINSFEKSGIVTLNACNAEIGGDFLLERAVCVGEVNLWGLKVGRNLRADETAFLSAGLALSSSHLCIAGDLSLKETRVLGDIWLHHAEVGGYLDSQDLRIVEEYKHGETIYKWDERRDISLRHMRIGSRISLPRLISETKLHIDLGDARAGSLEDSWPDGWGEEAVKRGLVSLNLDGFIYDRIHFPINDPRWVDYIPRWVGRLLAWLLSAPLSLASPAGEIAQEAHTSSQSGSPPVPPPWYRRVARAIVGRLSSMSARLRTLGTPQQHSAQQRIEWLALQGGFVPQPYRHLARVLRNQGHAEAAREVGIAEGWRAPAEPWYVPLRWIFGVCFGFGLAPLRASITLIVLFFVGWIGIHTALKTNKLVVTTNPVATVSVDAGGQRQMAIQTGTPSTATTEVTCTDEIEPSLYAIDVMLPVISLHQETACDISPGQKYLWLRVAKFFYSALGKLAVALAIITFSGVLKSRTEE